jgi:hypothetical protein
MKAVLLAAVALAAPAVAQPKPQTVSITMTEHGYAPRVVTLRSGMAYTLVITNRSDKGHNLAQGAFFRDAEVAPGDRPLVGDGKVVLDAGQRAVIHLVAPRNRPGARYRFSSTVIADADNDYKGSFYIR